MLTTANLHAHGPGVVRVVDRRAPDVLLVDVTTGRFARWPRVAPASLAAAAGAPLGRRALVGVPVRQLVVDGQGVGQVVQV